MKKGILVDFQSDGTEVQIIGNGVDVLKAMELVLSALDESIGSTVLSDDMLERLVLKRKQAKERQNKPQWIIDDIISDSEDKKTPSLMGLLMMAEALNAMKGGDRESFTSFHDRFMNEFENRTGHAVKDRSKISDIDQVRTQLEGYEKLLKKWETMSFAEKLAETKTCPLARSLMEKELMDVMATSACVYHPRTH